MTLMPDRHTASRDSTVPSSGPAELGARSNFSPYVPSQLPTTTSAAAKTSRTPSNASVGCGLSRKTSPTARRVTASPPPPFELDAMTFLPGSSCRTRARQASTDWSKEAALCRARGLELPADLDSVVAGKAAADAGEKTGASRKVRTPQGEGGREIRPGETRGKVPQKYTA